MNWREKERFFLLIEMKIQRKVELGLNLAPEPNATTKKVSKLSIRLPDGSRHIRSFDARETIQVFSANAAAL